MEKLLSLLANFKDHKASTLLGVLGAVCLWAANRPELSGPLTWHSFLVMGQAGALLLLGGVTKT